MATDARQSLGRTGEALACAELTRRGYVILARRYRTRLGELDIGVKEWIGLIAYKLAGYTEAVMPSRRARSDVRAAARRTCCGPRKCG